MDQLQTLWVVLSHVFIDYFEQRQVVLVSGTHDGKGGDYGGDLDIESFFRDVIQQLGFQFEH